MYDPDKDPRNPANHDTVDDVAAQLGIEIKDGPYFHFDGDCYCQTCMNDLPAHVFDTGLVITVKDTGECDGCDAMDGTTADSGRIAEIQQDRSDNF